MTPNEDDCRAMILVRDWMERNLPIETEGGTVIGSHSIDTLVHVTHFYTVRGGEFLLDVYREQHFKLNWRDYENLRT